MAEKYRVYFTDDQILELHTLVETHAPHSNSLLKALHSQVVKIEAGLRKADYVEKERKTVESKLGLSSADLATNRRNMSNFDKLTPAEKRVAVVKKWLWNPIALTETEREYLNDWLYENGLLTAEEENTHIATLGNPHKFLPKDGVDYSALVEQETN